MVANLFLTVNTNLAKGSLPTALRRVMKEKFSSFDEYQLAKYNKSLKGPNMDNIEVEEEKQEILRGRDYDLKRLVRYHIILNHKYFCVRTSFNENF